MLMLKQKILARDIAKHLNKSASGVTYHIKELTDRGFVQVDGRGRCKFYDLTASGTEFLGQYMKAKKNKNSGAKFKKVYIGSSGMRKTSRLHFITIMLPIVKDEDVSVWESETQLKNWIMKHERITFPCELTLRKTTKHIMLYFSEFQADTQEQKENYILRGIISTAKYLKAKKNIDVDILNFSRKADKSSFTGQHFAHEMPAFENYFSDDHSAEIVFEAQAVDVFGNPLNQQKRIWHDKSKGVREIETNCNDEDAKFLLMPRRIESIDQNIKVFNQLTGVFAMSLEKYNKNIELHLGTLENMNGAISEMRDLMKKKRQVQPTLLHWG